MAVELVGLVGAEIEPEEDAPEVEQDEEIQSLVTRSLETAIAHYEENLEPDQEEATDYYFGRPFGDEKEGRSQVVSTDVRDAVLTMMPQLMEIFFGSESVVEFKARRPDQDEQAKQRTDYINYVIREDNDGFLEFYSAFKDALVRRLGVFKWYNHEKKETHSEEASGLSIEQVAILMQEPGVEVEVLGQYDAGAGPLFDVRIVRQYTENCPKFEAVPPEEFVFTPDARDLKSAPLIAHVREVPAGELIAMGLDEDLVNEARGKKRALSSDSLESARRFDESDTDILTEEDDRDDSVRPVLFAEAYLMYDGDGDGQPELRIAQCVGADFKIANADESGLPPIVDEVPFGLLCPDPEPHTIVGLSVFDYLKEIQRIKSQLHRGMLNSLALSIDQKMEVVQGEVNIPDLLNPEIGGIVRTRKPGMIREIKHTFVGPDILPVLDRFDQMKEDRTGTSKAAAGLDAAALQSSTAVGVQATLTLAQMRIKLIARIFAETGVRALFKGLSRLIARHQNAKRIVKLRGKYVEIDPRSWDASMDVRINVALGNGSIPERLSVLAQLYAAQKELQASGSPLVSNVEIRATLAKITELSGYANPAEFFREWGQQEEAQMQQAQAENPPPPDPALLLVQVEQGKLELARLEAEAKHQLEVRKMMLEDDRERDKMARDFALKEEEIRLKYAVAQESALQKRVEADRKAQERKENAGE